MTEIEDFRRAVDTQRLRNLLSPEEWKVAQYLARGSTYHEISETLGVSRSKVRDHVASIFTKFKGQGPAQAGLREPRRPHPSAPGNQKSQPEQL